MYASCGNSHFIFNINYNLPANGQWGTATLHNIKVTGGKVTIGIYAEGEANASCQIDDITLTPAAN